MLGCRITIVSLSTTVMCTSIRRDIALALVCSIHMGCPTEKSGLEDRPGVDLNDLDQTGAVSDALEPNSRTRSG